MTVMEIGVMPVRVHQPRMNMDVGMRLSSVPGIVRVLMVLVMCMGMAVLLRIMCVQVPVPFRHVQPYADRHQRAANDQLQAEGLALETQGDNRAEEWRNGKVR